MAKARLTYNEVDLVVGMLAGWKGRLTWELVVQRVEAILGRTFTRQGLDKNETISIAFGQAKDRRRKQSKKEVEESDRPPELAAAERRVEVLRAEIAVLKAEQERFLEKFATWLYNARSRGVSEFDLNRQLPDVDRDKSERRR
ncbi:hypothetical protein ACC718_09950 [Rhizobium ruizarguesonis]|jgi:hypothetical protein